MGPAGGLAAPIGLASAICRATGSHFANAIGRADGLASAVVLASSISRATANHLANAIGRAGGLTAASTGGAISAVAALGR